MKINIPTSWDDVTVNQFQALSQLDRKDFEDDLSYTIAVLQVLCNLDSMHSLPMSAVSDLAPHIAFMKSELPKVKYDQVYLDNDIYEWIPSFNSMTVGEAISIELPIDLEELSHTLSYDVILAVMLRKDGVEFNASNFKENRVRFGELPITEVIGMLLFFLNGGQTSTGHTKTYSIHPMKNRIIRKKKLKLRNLLGWLKKKAGILNG